MVIGYRNLDGCCYMCAECGRRACPEQWPSPKEDERICADCAELEEACAGVTP